MTSVNRTGFLLSCVLLLCSCTAPVEQKHAITSADVVSPKPSAALTSKLHQIYLLDDNVQYAIDSVEKSKYLGQMSKGKTAGEDALFYIVRFHAKNNGNQNRTVVTDNFSVKTVDGQSYAPSTDGKTAVLVNGGTKDLFESQLEPGMAKPFLAIFDIPVRFVDSGADLIVPSSKAGSNDRWVVRLDNSKNVIRGSISPRQQNRTVVSLSLINQNWS